jgi:hypothetical protein
MERAVAMNRNQRVCPASRPIIRGKNQAAAKPTAKGPTIPAMPTLMAVFLTPDGGKIDLSPATRRKGMASHQSVEASARPARKR